MKQRQKTEFYFRQDARRLAIIESKVKDDMSHSQVITSASDEMGLCSAQRNSADPSSQLQFFSMEQAYTPFKKQNDAFQITSKMKMVVSLYAYRLEPVRRNKHTEIAELSFQKLLCGFTSRGWAFQIQLQYDSPFRICESKITTLTSSFNTWKRQGAMSLL